MHRLWKYCMIKTDEKSLVDQNINCMVLNNFYSSILRDTEAS